ncbi:hypothetical protein GQ600_20632 [Phytophthora cactorum]|nr:hypothetical protein GQ600_20632 [Phytophthora cactorum]
MIRADLPGCSRHEANLTDCFGLYSALRKVEASIRDMYQSTVEERTANALSWVRQLKEEPRWRILTKVFYSWTKRFGIRKVVGSRARMRMCPNATIF